MRSALSSEMRVRRTAAAVETLGTKAEIAMYEEGVCGIRVGDREADVRARLGPSTKELPAAASGCIGHTWGPLFVYACHGAVVSVSTEGGCP